MMTLSRRLLACAALALVACTSTWAGPPQARGFFDRAMASLDPYVAAGRFEPIEGAVEPAPCHTACVTDSDSHGMVIRGGLMQEAAAPFAPPTVKSPFDTDHAAAAPVRVGHFDDAAAGGHHVALAHQPFPGTGRQQADGSGGCDSLPTHYERAR